MGEIGTLHTNDKNYADNIPGKHYEEVRDPVTGEWKVVKEWEVKPKN